MSQSQPSEHIALNLLGVFLTTSPFSHFFMAWFLIASLNSFALLKHIPNLKVGFSISTSALNSGCIYSFSLFLFKKSASSANTSTYRLISPIPISISIEPSSSKHLVRIYNSSRSIKGNPSSLAPSASLPHLLSYME
ncbi:hypothetical protein EUGRSUZ_K00745 [Eucalyptus grandis]|uniref:Uncharacterized protein n=2 Tax=Eucalyptus grandis TaxID=71139 RepID=A0ACC3IRM1_EUCGR|nr:hypothetical protein EUGRSUZ_K00745 [Eucalyptus grandis]